VQEIGSSQNKVAALADALPLRLILGQPASTISSYRVIDAGTARVSDLSGMGDEPARLLGALVVSQFAQAPGRSGSRARADGRDARRVDNRRRFRSALAAKNSNTSASTAWVKRARAPRGGRSLWACAKTLRISGHGGCVGLLRIYADLFARRQRVFDAPLEDGLKHRSDRCVIVLGLGATRSHSQRPQDYG
jgi:hypothetical protein